MHIWSHISFELGFPKVMWILVCAYFLLILHLRHKFTHNMVTNNSDGRFDRVSWLGKCNL